MIISKKFSSWLRSKAPAIVLAVFLFRFLLFGCDYVFKVLLRSFYGVTSFIFLGQILVLVATLAVVDILFGYFRNKPIHPILGSIGLLVLLIPVNVEVRSYVDVSSVNGDRATTHGEMSCPFELRCYIGHSNSSGEPVLGNEDIISAVAECYVDDIYNVRLMLTDEGAKRIRSVTTENIGSELSFFIDGVFVVAARIQEPIDQNSIIFPGEFSQIQAEGVAKGIMSAPKKRNGRQGQP